MIPTLGYLDPHGMPRQSTYAYEPGCLLVFAERKYACILLGERYECRYVRIQENRDPAQQDPAYRAPQQDPPQKNAMWWLP